MTGRVSVRFCFLRKIWAAGSLLRAAWNLCGMADVAERFLKSFSRGTRASVGIIYYLQYSDYWYIYCLMRVAKFEDRMFVVT